MAQQPNEPPTDGMADDDAEQPFLAVYETWKPVFGALLDSAATRRENFAVLAMFGAHVIAIFVLLIGLKLYQWLA